MLFTRGVHLMDFDPINGLINDMALSPSEVGLLVVFIPTVLAIVFGLGRGIALWMAALLLGLSIVS